MRNWFTLLLFSLVLNVYPQPKDKALVKHLFNFKIPNAGEVYMVWGLDGWKTCDSLLRPKGTVIRKKVMHSPMPSLKSGFSVTINVPVNSKINYGFLVIKDRKGSSIQNIWEGPYQTDAREKTTYVIASKESVNEVEKASNSESQGAKAVLARDLVTLRLKYHSEEAGVVNLIWGINGWTPVSEIIRPEGTDIQNFVMKSPMKSVDNNFVIDLTVPQGSVVNYGFMIKELRTGTKIIPIWDGRKDVILVNKNRVVYRNPSESAKNELKQNREFPDPLSIGLWVLLAISCLFFIHIFLKKGFLRYSFQNKPALLIGFSISLSLLLFIIRGHILGIHWKAETFGFSVAHDAIVSSYYDFLYILVIGLFFGTILFFIRKHFKLSVLFTSLFILTGILSLIVALFNIGVVKMLGGPFNYQWLYYSDFLESSDAKNALSTDVTGQMIINILALCLSYLMLSLLFTIYSRKVLDSPRRNYFLIPSAISLAVLFFYSSWQIKLRQWENGKLSNPVIAFISSWINFDSGPGLLSVDLSPGYEKEFTNCNSNQCRPFQPGKIRNVVLFVLESVPAEYINIYNKLYNVTPNLNEWAARSLVFKNIYAHSPSTNRSMVSILGGVYPWISTKSVTQEHPSINKPTISSELKKNGYRTSFFSAADNSFQGVGNYLSFRGFDLIEDYKSNYCSKRKLEVKGKTWDNSNGADDNCIIDEFNNWISADKTKPFFSVLWTMQTHYPYFVTGEEINYNVNNEIFNRYLNALKHGDEALGRLLKNLEEKQLMESTLVIVVGDHGEAFGRHEFYGHASRIYEENIHVPLIFINPLLFHGDENVNIGGHADIASTLFSLMNIKVPIEWQGQSLFNKERKQRTYFYAPWSDFLFGFREKNIKFIYDATTDKYEVYDLEKDPLEKHNVSANLEKYISEGKIKLASWVQYQNKFMEDSFKN